MCAQANFLPKDDYPTPEILTYFQELGRFVTVFATVEKLLFALSGLVMRVPLPVAQAAFGGSARVKESMDRINKVLEAVRRYEPECNIAGEMKADLASIFAQIGLINSTRNEILHYGIELGPGDEWSVSNRHLAFKPDKINDMRISSAALKAMITDMWKVHMTLAHYFLKLQGDPEGMGEYYADAQVLTWQYKLKRPG